VPDAATVVDRLVELHEPGVAGAHERGYCIRPIVHAETEEGPSIVGAVKYLRACRFGGQVVRKLGAEEEELEEDRRKWGIESGDNSVKDGAEKRLGVEVGYIRKVRRERG
jgi:hypothetical protein